MSTLYVIYALHLVGTADYRYVGMTTLGEEARLKSHWKMARSTTRKRRPLYDWMGKHGLGNIGITVLETTEENLDILAAAEIKWIADFKAQGYKLLNLADGGLGPNGHVFTLEQRQAQSLRQKGRKGVSLPGQANPFYGGHHSEQQRKKWSEERKGSITGKLNPNFGKFGSDHPSHGRVTSEAARKLASEAKLGNKNPNYGKPASTETRAKMSAVRKGRPMPSSARSAHTRWHTSKNVFKPSCGHCVTDSEASITPINKPSRDS